MVIFSCRSNFSSKVSRFLTLICILIANNISLTAQQDSLPLDIQSEVYEDDTYVEPKKIWMGEFNLLYSIPTGAFADRVDNQFWGLELGIMRQYAPSSPLFWRLGVSYIHMGGFSSPVDRFLILSLRPGIVGRKPINQA